jgi:hypothetical protein
MNIIPVSVWNRVSRVQEVDKFEIYLTVMSQLRFLKMYSPNTNNLLFLLYQSPIL